MKIKRKKYTDLNQGNSNLTRHRRHVAGRLTKDANKKASFKYDYFGRMIEKNEGDIVTAYAYNPWGQRTTRVTKQSGLTLNESKTYDEFGRLTEIKSNEKVVKYSYNKDNQLIMQLIDGIPVEFTYTKYGQLESKMLGGKIRPISSLKYVYTKDGMIAGRVVNDKVQMYAYDQKGQLLSVADMQGNIAEAYKYDPAGNILSKNIAGKITTFTYDKANQLATSATGDKVTNYAYDAAGRLIKEGSVASGFKTYSYGYLDKILEVQENGEQIAAFDYHIDGQIASAVHGDKTENFIWDGLALIHRGDNSFINEPYVTGGNPILSSKDGVMFNDMLGTTLGVKSSDGFNAVSMTAFGETENKSAMFTGKPYIGELGYAFLFRNYRAELGKWQTKDPLGYPDGWNNLAYCNNFLTTCIDIFGGWAYDFVGDWTDNERSFFGQIMNQARISIAGALTDLNNLRDNHADCGITSCPCPLHNETTGLNQLRQILANTVSKLNSADILKVEKDANMGNVAGTYNPGLLGNETMKVNVTPGGGYNFFTGPSGTASATAIHESSHAGGSDDYLNEHGSPDHRWNNAHTIENISRNGLSGIMQAMNMPLNCLCE